jgi:hypothetical protein
MVKRPVVLYLENDLVAELKARKVNISAEVNAYLAKLLGKTPEPKRKMDFENVVPNLERWAWDVLHVLSVGSIWAEQGMDPPEERIEWLSRKAEGLGIRLPPEWWKTQGKVMEMARRCGFKAKEWMELEREKVKFGDLLRETDLLDRMVKAILLSRESRDAGEAKVGRGG